MGNKKILFCASASSHILNFHILYIQQLRGADCTIHTATDNFIEDENIDKSYAFTYEKGGKFYKNISTICRLSKIMRGERYDIVSTHSMLSGLLGRVGVILTFNRNIKVIHTCHGYLFNDNGSLKSKIMVLLEKILSLRTDALFVMNNDDYAIATKYKLCKKIEFINGMGIDVEKLQNRVNDTLQQISDRYNIPQGKVYFLCVGEFSKRKNQQNIIHAFSIYLKSMSDEQKNIYHLIFAGDGNLLEECKKLCCDLNISQRVTFCGYVKDTGCLYRSAYCVISASKYEGLPFNIMESLYYNTPVIASNVKGNKDLVVDGLNGYLFEYGDSMQLSELLKKISDADIYAKLKSSVFLDKKYWFKYASEKVIDTYANVFEKMQR